MKRNYDDINPEDGGKLKAGRRVGQGRGNKRYALWLMTHRKRICFWAYPPILSRQTKRTGLEFLDKKTSVPEAEKEPRGKEKEEE